MFNYFFKLLLFYIIAAISESTQVDFDTNNRIASSNTTPDTPYNDTVFDYFYGNNSYYNQVNNTDNLDFSALDPETVRKIYDAAHAKNFIAETEYNKTALRYYYPKADEAFNANQFYLNKTMDLMQQSIYSTRLRLADTRALRKRYSQDFCYNVAIFYGTLMQLRLKMDNVYATMNKFPYEVRFLWFLGLYERTVAMHIDVLDLVEKLFKMHGRHKKMIYGESGEIIVPPRPT